MEDAFSPRWFATPDGGTVYALTHPDRLVEHQRIGRFHRRHVLEVTTYADRLHVAGLLERVAEGLLRSLDEREHAEAVSNIERLEPLP